MSRPLLRRAAVLAISALVAPLLPAAVATPASAQTAPAPALRDVREFGCPPGQVQRPGVQPRFTDTRGNTFELEIDCLAFYEVTLGTGTGATYDPAGTVTRAQMAQFLARVATKAGLTLNTSDAGFRDIAFLPQAARNAINGIANLDVARGRAPGVFAPLDPVRRDQMASFIDRLQERVQPPLTATRDYFTDDGGTAEASINRLAEAGIVQGVAAGQYAPARSVTRQQMAGFLSRYLDLLVQAGKVTGPVRNNEVLPVAPAESVVLGSAATQIFTATNLVTGTAYRVLLVDTRTLRRATTTPQVLFFTDADRDRVADTGTYSARITRVNGATVTPPNPGEPATAVGAAANGALTFEVGGGRGDDDVTPVLFPVGGRSPLLELAADGRAVEVFGVGGRTTFAPEQAPAGSAACANGCLVTSVDRTTSSVTLAVGGSNRLVFRYATGDSFSVRNGGTTTAVPANEFMDRLTRGDTLTVNPYRTGPSGTSSFVLTDTSATAPTVEAVSGGTGTAAGTVRVTVTSATPVVTYDRFVIERAPVTPTEACSAPVNQAGTFQQVADVPADADADRNTMGFQFVDRPGAGCFRYRALGIVDGQRSMPGTSGNVSVAAVPVADTQRPVSQSALVSRDQPPNRTADTGDQLTVVFNEALASTVPSDAFVQVRRTNGALQVIRNQADGLFRVSGSTLTIDLAPGFNAGPYPLTVVDAGRITDVAGNPWSVETSPDRVID